MVVHFVSSSQFFAIRNSTSSLYKLFVRKCDSCDCYADVDDPEVNLKLGNYTKDWYTNSKITHRDSRDLEWRCSIDGNLLYRNSASNDDQVWYDINNAENIELINHKLDPCKNYIDIELALASGQEVGQSGGPFPCFIMALTDVKDPIKNDDYLFISSFKNGSKSICRHQLLSSEDSLVLKVTPGANLTIYNEQCKKTNQEDISTGSGSGKDAIKGNTKKNQPFLRIGQTGVGSVEETTEGKTTSATTEKPKHKHGFTLAPGKKNWILIGPIGGAVGFVILTLALLTFCCWKKRREIRSDKRNTWHEEIYFDFQSPSAQSSIRSKRDFTTSFSR